MQDESKKSTFAEGVTCYRLVKTGGTKPPVSPEQGRNVITIYRIKLMQFGSQESDPICNVACAQLFYTNMNLRVLNLHGNLKTEITPTRFTAYCPHCYYPSKVNF